MDKKGYFFTLDAMLSLGVLILGSFLIFTSYISIPSGVQTGVLAEDIMGFLSSTKIKDLNDPYAGIGGTLWQQGDITNADNTLLQQIGEFYYLGKNDIAENFIAIVTADLIPPQFKFEFWIDDSLIHPSSPTQQHLYSKGNTSILLPSKKLAYGIFSNDLYGPYEAEVMIWQ